MDERHVRPCMETGHRFDDEHYASGNYYRTRDEASRNASVPECNKHKHIRDPKENFDRDAYLRELHALKELRRLGLAEPISAKYKKNKSYKIENIRSMKTASEINALIPVLVDLLVQSPKKIGKSSWQLTEDGWQREDNPETNCLDYDHGGWEIEVTYECTGFYDIDDGDRDTPPSVEINRAWGEVTDIYASRYDEDTEETVEYSYDELRPLYAALDEVLREI